MIKPLIDTLSFILRHPIAGRTRVRSLMRYADWQIRSRRMSEVVVPWIGDTRLVARSGMSGATGNIYCGLHEYAEMAFTLHMLRPGDLFCDAGANIGSYSVLASGSSARPRSPSKRRRRPPGIFAATSMPTPSVTWSRSMRCSSVRLSDRPISRAETTARTGSPTKPSGGPGRSR